MRLVFVVALVVFVSGSSSKAADRCISYGDEKTDFTWRLCPAGEKYERRYLYFGAWSIFTGCRMIPEHASGGRPNRLGFVPTGQSTAMQGGVQQVNLVGKPAEARLGGQRWNVEETDSAARRPAPPRLFVRWH